MKKQQGKTEYKVARRARRQLMDRLGSALAAALLCGPLLRMLLEAVGIAMPMGQACLSALCVGGFLACFCTSLPWAVGAVAAAGAAAFFASRFGVGPHIMLLRLIMGLVSGEEGLLLCLAANAAACKLLAALLLGAACYGFARMQGGAYPALVLTIAVFLLHWYTCKAPSPLAMAMAAGAVTAMLARALDMRVPWRRVIPCALAVALISCACMPSSPVTWQPMANAAQRVRDLISDYFNFTSPRTSYSVANDGWQPMGERLGGPAEPSEEAVFTVDARCSLLLRGSTKRTYTTYSWVDTGLNNRYVYRDLTKNRLRSAIFGVDLLSRLESDSALEEADLHIRFLKEGSSSLFVPTLLTQVEAPLEMAVYFNDGGEVFLTRDVREGDAYSAKGYSPVHGQELAQLIAEAEQKEDARYESILQEYTALPEGIDSKVYALAQQIAAQGETGYEKACQLAGFFRSSSFHYTIDVDYPPVGRDFVSYFLLESREGYCTYYATSFAVLARMMGLPSRYVEGYKVSPSVTGETVVTGEDAHAWAEIYFQGIGWIAFDPTPGAGEGDNGSGENAPNGVEPTPAPEEHGPEPTSEPTPEPDPTPDPAETPEDEPTPEPSEEPQEAPTSLPTEEPPLNGDSDGQDSPQNHAWIWKLLIALALLAALIALAMRRERATRVEAMADRHGDLSDQMMIWYRAVLTLLSILHLEPRAGETPVSAARRVAENRSDWQKLLQLSQVVSACRYGEGEPNEKAIRLAREAYREAYGHLNARQRISFHLRRMTRGIGNWRSIP